MPGPERFQDELRHAVWIAEEAGRILLRHYEHPADVERKEDGTLVSRADREAAHFITAQLRSLFPDHAMLNEELRDDGSRFQRPLCWVVDPLDGTKEYLNKIGDFGVLLGLLENFEPVLGVTLKPLKGELAFAVRGQGAWLKDAAGTRGLHVSAEERIRAIVSRSRRNPKLDSLLAAIEPAEVSQMGGSLKTVEVARGRVNLFLSPPGSVMHHWDLCAPSVVLAEAGGLLTDVYGQAIDFAQAETAHGKGIVAASHAIHDTVLRRLRRVSSSGAVPDDP
jgi:3'(2'), 5'-bisphosphate nucleotidase